MRPILFAALSALSLASPLNQGKPTWADLSTYTQAFIANHTFPGAQLAVVSSGNKVHYAQVFGSMTYEGDQFYNPVTADTLYDIASLSKVVAATSCTMKLYEQGLINLDDKWVKYVPQANNNGKDAITLRHLLLHSAGFAPDYPFYDVYANVTKDILLNWLYTTPLDYTPGTATVYSDNSMVALQLVIEKVTGKSMWVYAEQEIFLPLGMNSTRFLPAPWDTCAPTLLGYPGWRSLIRCSVHDPTAFILGGVSGNAGVFTNHGDLILFMTMMLQKGAYTAPDGSQQRLFQAATVELFTTAPSGLPYANTRALGWDTIPSQKAPCPCGQDFTPGYSFGHTGYTGTTLWGDFKQDVAFIALTNRVWPDDGVSVPTKNRILWYRNNLANMIVERIKQQTFMQ